jgi:hypothetical protein
MPTILSCKNEDKGAKLLSKRDPDVIFASPNFRQQRQFTSTDNANDGFENQSRD